MLINRLGVKLNRFWNCEFVNKQCPRLKKTKKFSEINKNSERALVCKKGVCFNREIVFILLVGKPCFKCTKYHNFLGHGQMYVIISNKKIIQLVVLKLITNYLLSNDYGITLQMWIRWSNSHYLVDL